MSGDRWRIFYSGGKTLEGQGKPVAPIEARGILAIVQDHPTVGVEIVTGADYYVWQYERWWGVDLFGLYDYLLETGMVLFGRTVTREEYGAIMRQVRQAKAGWLPRERKE